VNSDELGVLRRELGFLGNENIEAFEKGDPSV
jgi:hypothetical protein